MRLPRVLIVFAVWLGVVSVFLLQRLVGEAFRDGPIPTGGLVLEVVYWIPWLLLAPVLILLARRFPLTHQSWRRNIPVHLVAGFGFALVEAIASALAERAALALMGMPGGPRRLMPLGAAWAVYTVIAMWKYWAFLGIWTAFAAARRSRDRELEAARLESSGSVSRGDWIRTSDLVVPNHAL